MRMLIALVLAGLLAAAGCAGESSSPSSPGATSSIGPEDTLPVLGLWTSAPLPNGRTVTLTLSDDNTYVADDGCTELPGRWQLSGGRVVLTPDDDGVAQCEPNEEPFALPAELLVDGDRLLPDDDGLSFSR